MSEFSLIDDKILEKTVQNLNSSTCELDILPTSFFKSLIHLITTNLIEIINHWFLGIWIKEVYFIYLNDQISWVNYKMWRYINIDQGLGCSASIFFHKIGIFPVITLFFNTVRHNKKQIILYLFGLICI